MSALFREDGTQERYADGRRAYKCDQCGLVSSWTPSWVYFGTVEGEAGCLTFCSQVHGDAHEVAFPERFAQGPTQRRVAGRSR